MKSSILKFKQNEIKQEDLMKISGGISCGEAMYIINYYCTTGHPQCANYCGFQLQCTTSYGSGTYYLNLPPC